MICGHSTWDSHKCYFCGKSPHRYTELKDRCNIPSCMGCHVQMMENKKFALENGIE